MSSPPLSTLTFLTQVGLAFVASVSINKFFRRVEGYVGVGSNSRTYARVVVIIVP